MTNKTVSVNITMTGSLSASASAWLVCMPHFDIFTRKAFIILFLLLLFAKNAPCEVEVDVWSSNKISLDVHLLDRLLCSTTLVDGMLP